MHVFLCVARFAVAQTKVTFVSRPSLKGHVKSVTTYSFHLYQTKDYAAADTTGAEKITEIFDEQGRELKENKYDKYGKLSESDSFTYFGDSVAEEPRYDYYYKTRVVINVFKYDAQGKETEFYSKSLAQPPNQSGFRTIYKYNDKGNRISEEQYYEDLPIMKTTSTYNELHQRTQSIYESYSWVFRRWSRDSIKIFAYDSMGNEVKTEVCYPWGAIMKSSTSSYDNFDNQGNWLKETSLLSGDRRRGGRYAYSEVTRRVIEYY